MGIGALVVVIIAWFAILFTGPVSEGDVRLRAGRHALGCQGGAYAFVLVTDRYPPFSLAA